MRIYATDDREYWTRRRIDCSGCGELARHYEVTWDRLLAPDIFGVPYASHNGGIHHEVGVPDEWRGNMDHLNINECTVYLSECCDVVHATLNGYVFGEKKYHCRAFDLDDAEIQCRLNAHTRGTHLAGFETPYRRNEDRRWS